MGSVFEMIPGGEVPGALFNGAGNVLSAPFEFVGNYIDDQNLLSQIRGDDTKYLGQVAQTLAQTPNGPQLSAATINALVNSDPDQVAALAATGMSAQQMQDLAPRDPQLVQSDHSYGPSLETLPQLEKNTGMSGAELHDLLVAADGNSGGEGLRYMMNMLGTNVNFSVRYAQSRGDLIQALKADASGNSEFADVDNRAIAFLASQPSSDPVPAHGPR